MNDAEARMHNLAIQAKEIADDYEISVREVLEVVAAKYNMSIRIDASHAHNTRFHYNDRPIDSTAYAVKPAVIQILEKCIEIYRAKNSDYNHPTKHGIDPLSNFRVAEELGVPAYLGALIRASDKWERIKTLTYKQQVSGEEAAVKDESIEDTLMDMINYAAIILALYKERNDK